MLDAGCHSAQVQVKYFLMQMTLGGSITCSRNRILRATPSMSMSKAEFTSSHASSLVQDLAYTAARAYYARMLVCLRFDLTHVDLILFRGFSDTMHHFLKEGPDFVDSLSRASPSGAHAVP